MLDTVTDESRLVANCHEASNGTKCATTAVRTDVATDDRRAPHRLSYIAWNLAWKDEMRCGLTNVNEKTFDIEKFDFEGSYFRQGFTAAMLALGVRAEDEYDDLSLWYDARAFMVMRDVKWSKYLNGPEHEAVLAAYHKEWKSLKDTGVLVELFPGDGEYEAAVQRATSGRALLEKCRVIVRGCCEDREALDGPNFDYAANVCEITSVRNMLFQPREDPLLAADEDDAIVVASADIATAFLQSYKFGPEEPKRYLRGKDPVTGARRYFAQRGVLYGSARSSARWEKTLSDWLTRKDVGFIQGRNEQLMRILASGA